METTPPPNKKLAEKINGIKNWFFEKIIKIEEPSAKIIRGKKKMTQVYRHKHKEMKEEKLTTDISEIEAIIRENRKQLYTNKLDNLESMDKFLETYNLLKLNQEVDNLKRPITATVQFSSMTQVSLQLKLNQ